MAKLQVFLQLTNNCHCRHTEVQVAHKRTWIILSGQPRLYIDFRECKYFKKDC